MLADVDLKASCKVLPLLATVLQSLSTCDRRTQSQILSLLWQYHLLTVDETVSALSVPSLISKRAMFRNACTQSFVSLLYIMCPPSPLQLRRLVALWVHVQLTTLLLGASMQVLQSHCTSKRCSMCIFHAVPNKLAMMLLMQCLHRQAYCCQLYCQLLWLRSP